MILSGRSLLLPRVAAFCVGIAVVVIAQQAAPPGEGKKGGGKGKGGFGPRIDPVEETGFQPIFDGASLKGWDGDPAFWRVENGAIVGETAADKQPKQNTFLIWRGGSPADFELKLEYKLTSHNSGIQIRSIELPDIKWAMKGYQADMDAAQRYTGQLYEERGRGFLAMRGQFTHIPEGKRAGLVGSLGDGEQLKQFIKPGDWNEAWIIARGNTIVQLINGHVMSMLIDDDTAGRRLDGLIGLQVHTGPPMKVEARNIRLKKL
jgi:hypothetical protein